MRILLVGPLLLVLSGCDTENCTTVCHQYYGDDACHRQSVLAANGNTPEEAEEDCVTDCEVAVYTTGDVTDGQDGANFSHLTSEGDAIEFIECVNGKDYSEATFNATCERLDLDCPWFRW